MISLDCPQVRRLVRLALDEDLMLGDPTSELCSAEDPIKQAAFVAKEDLIVCGLPLARIIFDEFDASCKIGTTSPEGTLVKKGQTLLVLEAHLKHLLTLERTLLNFFQKLCGVATNTANFLSHAQGLTVLDTRKTTPGWRMLEKYATRTGGAKNHRMALGDMLMVKNNHIDNFPGAGGITDLLNGLIKRKPAHLGLEVETRNMSELKAALTARVDYVMLDNWPLAELKDAIAFIAALPNPPLVEISGGVTVERVTELKEAKVQLISVGALTRTAKMVDISMRIS